MGQGCDDVLLGLGRMLCQQRGCREAHGGISHHISSVFLLCSVTVGSCWLRAHFSLQMCVVGRKLFHHCARL